MRRRAVWVVCALLWCARAAADGGEALVTGVAWRERGGEVAGAALAALAAGALAARGVRARAVPPPAACGADRAPDEPACLRALLAALARGRLHAALAPAAPGAAGPPPRLRDAGLESLGALVRGPDPEEEGREARRACWAAGDGALRSLAELAAPERAADYALTSEDVAALADPAAPPRYYCVSSSEEDEAGSAEPCPAGQRAAVLTGGAGEARVLRGEARRHALHADVVVLGAAWSAEGALAALRARGRRGVACGRALDAAALRAVGARELGPPPCALPAAACPFEARPLLKLANVRALAHSPAALRALDRLALAPRELRALGERAAAEGPAEAAAAALAASAAAESAEARVAVLLPLSTRRDAFPGAALRAAAELAERDEEDAAAGGGRPESEGRMRFKAELVDDGCAATRAFRYLTDALGAEFGALSGAAGPACAGAWRDVARQSAALHLPLVAYTRQAAGEGGRALLAAGEARDATAALAALLAALGWRRVALLSESGARDALTPARLGVALPVHVELPEGEDTPLDLIDRWAVLAARASARVLVVAVEDARAARAALCCARRAGLTPRTGAVLVLGGELPAGWLARADAGAACSRAELALQAEGHLRLRPEWAARWAEGGTDARWTQRWRRAAGAPPAARPPPHAALLYDSLRLWARSLRALLAARPDALDDLHRPELVTFLLENATRTPYAGLTGEFEWEGLVRGGAAAELRVEQWRGGVAAEAGRWRGGALRLHAGALRWATPDGGAPDDGTERCALRPLADALHAECRAAWACAGALLAAAAAALLAAVGWHCRRRAAREHRARVRAFGMRALGPKGGAAGDRWEVPRDRLVINRKLGEGAFGAVYGGRALLPDAGGWTAVAVKTLKAGAGPEEKLDFLSEAEAMKRLSHENVVRLVGVVTASEPVCTVMEYVAHGDLRGFLAARRHLAGDADVTPGALTAMARDAARGLAHVARAGLVHRDVAARNCLVDAARRVKLADFGMARVVGEGDYYRLARRGMLPVRWMPPEALARGEASPAGDVWALGVLLYEIVTLGALPWRGHTNAQVLDRVKAGHALPLPPGIKPQLEGLMRSCWRREPRARPGAAAVARYLAEWPRLLTPCLQAPDQERCSSWAAPAPATPTSGGTDCTYLSADASPPAPPAPPAAPAREPADTDPFLAVRAPTSRS